MPRFLYFRLFKAKPVPNPGTRPSSENTSEAIPSDDDEYYPTKSIPQVAGRTFTAYRLSSSILLLDPPAFPYLQASLGNLVHSCRQALRSVQGGVFLRLCNGVHVLLVDKFSDIFSGAGSETCNPHIAGAATGTIPELLVIRHELLIDIG